MSERVRRNLFLVFAAAFAALLVVGLYGLPPFGHYPGPYGDRINLKGVGERHATDVVTSVMFDYRGLDTLGEEFILFAAVLGVALVLREKKEEPKSERAEKSDQEGREQPMPAPSDATVFFCLGLVPFILLFGAYIVLQAHISVGGGFQGGIALAAAWLLIFLARENELLHRLSPKPTVEFLEAAGAGTYALIGLSSLVFGAAFLQNLLPLGQSGELLSAGTIPIINLAVGVEVTAAFVLLLTEFTKEAEKAEPDEHKQGTATEKPAREEPT